MIKVASVRQEAINSLGKEDDYINLKGLNKERQIANNKYNTQIESLKTEYNNLLEDILNKRTANTKDFNKGRSTVRENSFMATRNDLSNLATRGLSGGIAQLNKLGNRMETGRQYSDLANTYYNTVNALDTAQKQGTDTYNLNLTSAKNDLDSILADIAGREADRRNAYKTALANLMETIRNRRMTQSYYNYTLEKDKEAAKDARDATLTAKLKGILGNGSDIQKVYDAANYYMGARGGNFSDALKYMTNEGIYDVNKYKPKNPTTSEKLVYASYLPMIDWR